MSDQLLTTSYFTKISDQLADDLANGILTLEEYGLLVFMLQSADKETGILITNSGSLVRLVNKDRTWVHNRLASLKRKNRIHSPTRGKPELNQKRGSKNPYPITFRDHIPLSQKTRSKPEANQKLTRSKPLMLTSDRSVNPSEPAETLDKTRVANSLLKKDKDNNNNARAYAREETAEADLQWFYNLLLNIAPGWGGPVNPVQQETFNEILKFPDYQIRVVCQRAAEFGIKPSGMLSWILKGLDKFSEFYEQNKKAQLTPLEQTYMTPEEHEVSSLKRHYKQIKAGMFEGEFPTHVAEKFDRYAADVEKYADQLDFTRADWEQLIAEWKVRQIAAREKGEAERAEGAKNVEIPL